MFDWRNNNLYVRGKPVAFITEIDRKWRVNFLGDAMDCDTLDEAKTAALWMFNAWIEEIRG